MKIPDRESIYLIFVGLLSYLYVSLDILSLNFNDFNIISKASWVFLIKVSSIALILSDLTSFLILPQIKDKESIYWKILPFYIGVLFLVILPVISVVYYELVRELYIEYAIIDYGEIVAVFTGQMLNILTSFLTLYYLAKEKSKYIIIFMAVSILLQFVVISFYNHYTYVLFYKLMQIILLSCGIGIIKRIKL